MTVRRLLVLTLLLIGVGTIFLPMAYGRLVQSDHFGPEIKSFLELMRQEDIELEYQIQHREISRPEYIRSKNRMAVLRGMVLDIARETHVDLVPELHVVVASEVDQIVENGLSVVKGTKPGTMVDSKWRYLGSVTRGETFYVFERVARQ